MSNKWKDAAPTIVIGVSTAVLTTVVTSLLTGQGLRGVSGIGSALKTSIPLGLIVGLSIAALWQQKFAPRVNLLFHQADYGKVGYDREHGVFSWNRNFPAEYFSILIKIANEYSPNRRGKNLERVKAQVIFTYKKEGQLYHYSPGTWMEEETNSVNFAVGDTRYLVLAIGINFRDYWQTVINRRDEKSGIISLQWNDLPSMIGDAEVDVTLLTPSGKAVARMVCDFEWKWGENRPYIKNFRFPDNSL